ncbi:unnamed protein product, partial [Ectocarpus sp. 4 AP-2014]
PVIPCRRLAISCSCLATPFCCSAPSAHCCPATPCRCLAIPCRRLAILCCCLGTPCGCSAPSGQPAATARNAVARRAKFVRRRDGGETTSPKGLPPVSGGN